MAADPRLHVVPGQRLRLAAEQVNGLNRLLRVGAGFSSGGIASGPHAPYTWVYGKADEAIARWSVVEIAGLAVVPTGSDTAPETVQFHSMPIVSVREPLAGATAFGVAIDPIAEDGIGRVAVAGVVQVRKADLDKLLSKDVLWKDETWALVMLGGGGDRVRFGRVDGAWNKGAIKTVADLFPDGDQKPADREPFFQALNQMQTLPEPHDNGGRFVLCVKVDSTWMLAEWEHLCDSSYEAAVLSSTAAADSTDERIAGGSGVQVLVNVEGCVKWVKVSEVTYISNATLGADGLVFARKKAWVFESTNHVADVVVASEDCEP